MLQPPVSSPVFSRDLPVNPPGWLEALEQGLWPPSQLLILTNLSGTEQTRLLTVAQRGPLPLVLVEPESDVAAELRSRALAVLPLEHLNESLLAALRRDWQQRQRIAELEPRAVELDRRQGLSRELQLPPDPCHHLDFVASGLPGGLYQSRLEVDGRFWFNYISPAARQFFGLEPDQVTLPGEALGQLVVVEDLERVQAAILKAATELSLFRELIQMVGLHGQIYTMESIARPYREPDGAVQFMGVVIDRTVETSMRQQQDRLGRELHVRHQLQEQLLELIPSSYSIFNLATRTLEAIPVSNLESSFGCAKGERPTDFWASLLHPDDREAMEEALARTFTLADGEIATSELRYRNAQGIYFPIRTWTQVLERDDSGQPLRIATISADLSRLRHMESQLAQARDALDLVLMSSGSSYYCFPMDPARTGFQAYMSANLFRALGLSPDAEPTEALKILMERMHPEDRGWFDQTLASLREEGQTWNNLYRRLDSAGEYRWYQDQGSVIRDRDGVLYYQGISFDITEYKQTQEALEEASRAKDRFLAQMSHELRTPLTAMLSLCENLESGIYGQLPPAAARKLEGLQQSGRHLLSLIEDLLDFGRIASGEMLCIRSDVDVESFCRRTLELVRPLAADKDVRLRLLASLGDHQASLDERLIRQLLVNLLQNAIRFSSRGDRIDVEVDWRPSDDATQAPTLVLAVSDQGPGIDPQLQQRIFEPFFQGPPPPGETERGTGQGLALVKRIADLHGGTIELDSAPGRGSCFRLVLPPAAAEPQTAEPQVICTTRPVTEPKRDVSILLAEDDAIIAMAIADSLGSRNYRVSVASCGVTALTMFSELCPDLLILDVQMPNLSGLEVIRRIRALPVGRNVPILAMTAYAHPNDQDAIRQAGASDYLSKPIPFARLLERIEVLLRCA